MCNIQDCGAGVNPSNGFCDAFEFVGVAGAAAGKQADSFVILDRFYVVSRPI
jgi:hypothetical protein